MTANDTIAVSVLEPAAGNDAELVGRLTHLINVVYLTAESGLWREGTTRATSEFGMLAAAPEQRGVRSGAWYGHRGYRLSRTTTLDEAYPHLTPLLATPCDLEIHAKPLTGL